MADITIPSSRPTLATAALRAVDAVLDRIEGFIRSMGERPEDLRHALHNAQIHHVASAGGRGQAPI